MKAVKNGAHITYVDPRVTNTADKATRYWKIMASRRSNRMKALPLSLKAAFVSSLIA